MQAPVHNQSVMVRRAQGALYTVHWVHGAVNTTVYTVSNSSNWIVHMVALADLIILHPAHFSYTALHAAFGGMITG